LYQKFKEHPYKEAGIKGFTPPTPLTISTLSLQTSKDVLFKWPTLAKLNDELFPDLSRINSNEITKSNDLVALAPGIYTGPPPSAPTCLIPATPSANTLTQHIIISADNYFFMSGKISRFVKDIREWRLVCVTLAVTMQSYP
jgi:hypothetical protein